MDENEIKAMVKKIQILDFSQFIDVLNMLESYNTIEEIKEDIKIRKRILNENIKKIKGNME